MLDGFTFATAGQILFGAGTLRQVAKHAPKLGHHALLVTGATPDRSDGLCRQLDRADVSVTRFMVRREPELDDITAGAQLARQEKCDLIIGMGGGSAMDAAKAIAAVAPNQGPVTDYLEIIGKALPLERKPLPCIAIPTTAGTGSEVTRNAVIRSRSQGVKVSMRSPDMLPDLAVVDPELTMGLPPEGTAASGFDALCQLVEAYVSTKANPLTDSLCREGLARCAHSLNTACVDGGDLDARTDMALASLFSGLALANAGLGAVHGIAGPLGGMHSAPHGAVCARLLPGVAEANINALETHSTDSPFVERYREIAILLTKDRQATPAKLIKWIKEMVRQLNIPGLAHWGLKRDDVPVLAGQALRASSMKGNPVSLSPAILEAVILDAIIGSH